MVLGTSESSCLVGGLCWGFGSLHDLWCLGYCFSLCDTGVFGTGMTSRVLDNSQSLVKQGASAGVVVWDMEMSEVGTVGESLADSKEMLVVCLRPLPVALGTSMASCRAERLCWGCGSGYGDLESTDWYLPAHMCLSFYFLLLIALNNEHE